MEFGFFVLFFFSFVLRGKFNEKNGRFEIGLECGGKSV